MKNRIPVQINIPEPCSQEWETMDYRDCGRFCASCQKVVIDFTQMEDAEIVTLFQKNENLCGRFKVDQLARPLITQNSAPYSLFPSFYKKIIAGLLLTTAFFDRSFAQQKKQNISQHASKFKRKTAESVILPGLLLDAATSLPMSGFTVLLKSDSAQLSVQTNTKGEFTFHMPAQRNQKEGLISVVLDGTDYMPHEEQITLTQPYVGIKILCHHKIVLKVSEPPPLISLAQPQTVTTIVGALSAEPYTSVVYKKGSYRRKLWWHITHPFRRR